MPLAWELAGAHWMGVDVQWPIRLSVEMVGRSAARAELSAPELFGASAVVGEGQITWGRALRYRLRFADWHLSAEQRLSLWGSPMPFTLAEGELWHPDSSARHHLRLRFDPRSDLPRALASTLQNTLSRLRLDR